MNDNTNKPVKSTATMIKAQRDFAAALQTVAGNDNHWTAIQARSSATLTCTWGDGTIDTIVIVGAHAAYATRENAAGIETHRFDGTAEKVDAAMRALGDPTAPSQPDAHRPESGT